MNTLRFMTVPLLAGIAAVVIGISINPLTVNFKSDEVQIVYLLTVLSIVWALLTAFLLLKLGNEAPVLKR